MAAEGRAVLVTASLSTEEFYCQVSPNPKLDTLMSVLKEAVPTLVGGTFKAGDTCCAQFSEDEEWYRARVLAVSCDQAEVRFLDYGNTETTPLVGLRTLPAKLVKVAPQAKRCCLSTGEESLEDEWPSAAQNLFLNTLASEDEVRMAELDQADLDGCIPVQLWVGGQDVAVQLRAALSSTNGNGIVDANNVVDPNGQQLPMLSIATPVYAVGDRLDVVISCVTSAGQFCCQLAGSLSLLPKLEAKLSTLYNKPVDIDRLQRDCAVVGNLCCCDSAEYSWSRARIERVLEEDKLELLLLDQGCREVISLAKCWEACAAVCSAGVQCFPAKLAIQSGQCHASGVDAAVKSLQDSGSVVTAEIVVAAANGNPAVVSLTDSGGKPLLQVPDTPHSSNGEGSGSSTGGGELSSNKIPAAVEVVCNKAYSAVIVFRDADDLNLIHCQLVENAAAFSQLQAKLASTPAAALDSFRPGQLCLARSARDMVHYRAVLVAERDGECQVRFFDFGDSETVQAECLRELLPEFANLPCQAIPCHIHPASAVQAGDLAGCDDHVVFEATFEQRSSSQYNVHLTLPAGATTAPDSDHSTVKGSTNPTCVASSDKISAPDALVAGAPYMVAHIDSPESFWLQPLSCQDELTSLQERLNEYYSNAANAAACHLPVEKIVEGMYCVAQFSEDLAWYRAIIFNCSKSDSGKVKVRYVDYGNAAIVDNTVVHYLASAFLTPSLFSTCCSHADLDPAPINRWNDDACALFSELLLNTEVVLKSVKTNVSNGNSACDISNASVTFTTSDCVDALISSGMAKLSIPATVTNARPSVLGSLSGERETQNSTSSSPGPTTPVAPSLSKSPSNVNGYPEFLNWPEHSVQNVVLADIESLESIWLQDDSCIQGLDHLVSLIRKEKPGRAESVAVGHHYIVKGPKPKDCWRCVCKAIDETGKQASVFLYDYGRMMMVSTGSLIKWSALYGILRRVAVQCRLSQALRPASGFPVEVLDRIRALQGKEGKKRGALQVKVVEGEASTKCSIVFLINGVDLSNELLTGVRANTTPSAPDIMPLSSISEAVGQTSTPRDSRAFVQLGRQSMSSPTTPGPSRTFAQPTPTFHAGGIRRVSPLGFSPASQVPQCFTPSEMNTALRMCQPVRQSPAQQFRAHLPVRPLNIQPSPIYPSSVQPAPAQRSSPLPSPVQPPAVQSSPVQPSISPLQLARQRQPISIRQPAPDNDGDNLKVQLPAMQAADLVSGSVVHAVVQDVIDPSTFWCQLTAAAEQLEALQEKLSCAFNSALPCTNSSWPVSASCAAAFSEDGAIYRGIIEQITSSGRVFVRFADFGNAEEQSPGKLHVLTTELASVLPMQAVKCHLMPGQATEVAIEQEVSLRIKSASAGVAIVEVMSESGVEPTTTEPAAKPLAFPALDIVTGSAHQIRCVHEDDTSGVLWCHLAENDEQINRICNEIASLPEDSYLSLDALQVGDGCCAPSSDGSWYRAVVESRDGQIATVRFVDFGNSEEVDSVGDLNDVLRGIPVQAVACSTTNRSALLTGTEAFVSTQFERLVDGTWTVSFGSSSPPAAVSGPATGCSVSAPTGTLMVFLYLILWI